MCQNQKHVTVKIFLAVCFVYLCILFFTKTGSQSEKYDNSVDIGTYMKTFMKLIDKSIAREESVPPGSSVSQKIKDITNCKDKYWSYRIQQKNDYWVLYNYITAESAYRCQESVTYTTHGDFAFIENLIPLVKRWNGPISMAVYAPGTDFQKTLDSITFFRECTTLLIKKFVTFHIYFDAQHMPEVVPRPENLFLNLYNCSVNPPFKNVSNTDKYRIQKDLLYPVNVGRNIAREAAQTHFILASDVELYPSSDLISNFLAMIAENTGYLLSTNPKIFPISLFEVKADQIVPENKTSLKAMLKAGTAIPFHKSMCPLCHSIPNASEWMAANETRGLHVFSVGKRTGKFSQWEPIFIGTNSDPYYDERFSWEGKSDKMTQAYAICVLDYDFMILDNAFLVHKPGIKSYKSDKKRDKLAAETNRRIVNVIYPELKVLYGTRPGCEIHK